MKNAKFKLCLQASPTNENLSLEDCNPESDFQDWSWQGDSLMNRGTRSCLAVLGADRVQTVLCGGTVYTSWDCSDSLLSPLGNSQDYLMANRKGVTIGNVRSLKAQWQDAADRSVCEGKAGECCTHGSPWYINTHTHAAGECRKAQAVSWVFLALASGSGSQKRSPLLSA